MGIKPNKIEWPLGEDIHGRPVVLRQSKHYSGKDECFALESQAISQRDEGERMFSLSRANLLAIREITKDWK